MGILNEMYSYVGYRKRTKNDRWETGSKGGRSTQRSKRAEKQNTESSKKWAKDSRKEDKEVLKEERRRLKDISRKRARNKKRRK